MQNTVPFLAPIVFYIFTTCWTHTGCTQWAEGWPLISAVPFLQVLEKVLQGKLCVSNAESRRLVKSPKTGAIGLFAVAHFMVQVN